MKKILLVLALCIALLGFTPTSASASELNLPDNPKVLLVGDSYTEGYGATPKTNGYAYQIAGPLNWRLTIDGKGGSGYKNPTDYGAGIFNERLYNYPANSFDLVVIQGSSNDNRYCASNTDCSEVAGNINMTIRTVKARYPKAKIVMVGLTNPYGNPGGKYPAMNKKLKQYADIYGINYIDPMNEHWFVPGDGDRYANQDNGHPNNAGYKVYADRFIKDMRNLD